MYGLSGWTSEPVGCRQPGLHPSYWHFKGYCKFLPCQALGLCPHLESREMFIHANWINRATPTLILLSPLKAPYLPVQDPMIQNMELQRMQDHKPALATNRSKTQVVEPKEPNPAQAKPQAPGQKLVQESNLPRDWPPDHQKGAKGVQEEREAERKVARRVERRVANQSLNSSSSSNKIQDPSKPQANSKTPANNSKAPARSKIPAATNRTPDPRQTPARKHHQEERSQPTARSPTRAEEHRRIQQLNKMLGNSSSSKTARDSSRCP